MFKYRQFLDNCDALVEDAVDVSENLSDLSKYWSILNSLKKGIWHDHRQSVEIYFYGSRACGLATKSSDLDIFVDVNDYGKSNFYDDYYSENEKAQFLDEIYSTLEDRGNWKVKVYLPNMKVPVVRAKYLSWNLDCDIIVENGLGVASSNFIEHLFNIQPEAKWFFHFIRLWLESDGVKFKTYTLAMLVIYYLQTQNFMPSIKKIQKNLDKEIINGVEVQYDRNRAIFNYSTKKLRNYKSFVAAFFDFYSDFDFQRQFISVVDGKSYDFARVAGNPEMQKPMSVSSILENDVNAAKLVGHKKLEKFQAVCEKAVDIVENYDF